MQIGVRQGEGERRDAEDGNPDDELASVAIADRSAEDGAERDREEEKKQMELRALDREVEAMNEVEGIVVR